MLVIQCPHCNQRLQVPDTSNGSMVRCGSCQQPFQVQEPPLAPKPITPPLAISPSPPLPPSPQPDDQVQAEGLGRLVEVYKPFNCFILLYIALGLCAIGVPWAAIVQSMDNKTLIAPAIITATIGVLGVFLSGLIILLTCGLRLELHENGLVQHFWGRKVSCEWNELVKITYTRAGLGLGGHIIKLKPRGGKAIRLHDMLPSLAEVYSTIVESTRERLLRVANAELDHGEPLEFGDQLTVTREYLRHDRKRLAWDDIKEVQVGRQLVPGTHHLRAVFFITVRSRSQESTGVVPLENLPNLHVLTQLMVHRFGVTVYIDPHVLSPQDGERDGTKYGR